MSYLLLTVLFLATLVSCPSAAGQSTIEIFTDRSAFSATVSNPTAVDFEGIVPNSGFRNYRAETTLQTAGAVFRTSGGGRFGAGSVTIVGGWYNAGPIYETTTGAKLIWSPPNQPGNAYLEIALPRGATAVGADLWTAQPHESTVEVLTTTSDGQSRTVQITTSPWPAAAFVGFTSSSGIASIRFVLPRGQTALILDNLAFGRAAAGSPTPPKQAAGTPRNQAIPSDLSRIAERPPAESVSTTPVGIPRRRPNEQTRSGVIAYVRGSTEIRLIDPDGTNDRRLWTHPDITEQMGIFEMAWRPDGKELAFSSGHEAVASFYHADVYAVRPDGTGLRRITNPPAHTELARFPKGTVTVTVRNFQAASTTPGTFIVYVAGADEPQQVVLPAGTSKTLIFRSVADFGRTAQPVVAMFGAYRWFVPGTDVQAGRNVTAPALTISGQGIELLGAFRPVWRSDGSRISYRSGLCVVSSVSSEPKPGEYSFNPLFAGKNPSGACTWDWGPTSETADQLIYTHNDEGSNIYRIKEGGAHPGTKLTTFSDINYQLLKDLRWLPDASGLLYSNVNLMGDAANIYRYDFAAKRVTSVTRLQGAFARAFSISPDGHSVVFERCTTADEEKGCDLWIVGTDGSNPRLLVRNGLRPSWGKVRTV